MNTLRKRALESEFAILKNCGLSDLKLEVLYHAFQGANRATKNNCIAAIIFTLMAKAPNQTSEKRAELLKRAQAQITWRNY